MNVIALIKNMTWKFIAYLVAMVFLAIALGFGGYSLYKWVSGDSNFEAWYEISSLAVSLLLSISSFILGKKASDNSIVESFGRNVDSYLRNQNRTTMISRVHGFWIKGYLTDSLDKLGHMEVFYEFHESSQTNHWIAPETRPDNSIAHSIKSLVKFFDEYGRSLLVIGEPGSGKTIKLLELAEEFISEAKKHYESPIPVVLKLSTWAEKQTNLTDWIVEELNQKYKVPNQVGRNWVEQNELLLLLDGLDEVGEEHTQECAAAIKSFKEDHGLTGLIVTCRNSAFLRLANELVFPLVLQLTPLEQTQVRRFLRNNGLTSQTINMLLQVQETSELTKTPLDLSILTRTIKENPNLIGKILLSSNAHSLLYENYVETLLKHRSVLGINSTLASDQVKYFLSWLSQNLKKHNQAIFIIENIQPSWLEKSNASVKNKFFMFSRIMGGVIAGLAISLSYLFYKMLYDFNVAFGDESKNTIVVIAFLFSFGILCGLIIGLLDTYRLVEEGRTQSVLAKTHKGLSLSARFPYSLLISIVIGCMFWVLSNLIKEPKLLTDQTRIWISVAIGGLLSYVLVFSNYSSSTENDIRIASQFSWSWSKFTKSILVYGVMLSGLFFIISTFALNSNTNHNVMIWNPLNGKDGIALIGQKEPVSSFIFNDNGNRLLTLGENRSLILWNLESGDKLSDIPYPKHIFPYPSLRISPRLKYVLIEKVEETRQWKSSYIEVHQSGFVEIWDAVNGRKLAEIDGYLPFSSLGDDVDFSLDEKLLLLPSYSFPKLISLPDGTTIATLTQVTGRITASALAKNGEYAITGDDSGKITIWDAKTGIRLKDILGHTGEVTNVDISFNSSYFITTSKDGTAKYWDINFDEPLITIKSKNGVSINRAIFIDKDNQFLTVDEGNLIRVWGVRDGTLFAEIQGHTRWWYPYWFSDNGRILVVLSNVGIIDSKESPNFDGNLEVWDISEMKKLTTILGGFRYFTLSPDGGKLIATNTKTGKIELWNIQEGILINSLEDSNEDWLSGAFSSDSKLAVTLSKASNQIHVWDSNTGLLLSTIPNTHNKFREVEFVPNQTKIISSSVFRDYRILSFLFLSLGLIIAITVATERKKVVEESHIKGISFSLSRTTTSTLLIGLVFGTSISFIQWFIKKDDISSIALLGSFEAGLLFAVIMFSLCLGLFDIIKHKILRRILANQNKSLGNIRPMLEYACELLLLRRVGSGYIFAHPSIQEFFIDNPSK